VLGFQRLHSTFTARFAPEERRFEVKTILLAYDGTEPSERALARAAELAKAFDAAVHVTSVAPMLVGTTRGMGPYDPADPPSAHMTQLESARVLLAQEGVTATLAPAHGDAVDAILEIADKVDADLIVLGSHERSLVEHALGMSVSGRVTRKAHRDVLITH
jgi:nucleotide-binding universal stress UspA family protein